VPPGDPAALAAAIERMLTDRALAQRLGDAAHAGVGEWLATPDEYADNVLAVVRAVLTEPGTGPGAA
jgi:glycosyltransferase involved in cell wall biosynthesis